VDDDLPDHDAATMDRLFSRSMPDWSDRDAVTEYAAAGAEILGDDPAAARAVAGRIWDRTPGTLPAVQMANQLGMVFGRLDCKPRWRERLAELAMPALVVHGRRDPFFPVGNGEALAWEIRCPAPRPRTGLMGDPRYGRRRGRDGDARPLTRTTRRVERPRVRRPAGSERGSVAT